MHFKYNLNFLNLMENESFTDIIHKVRRSRKYRNESSKSELKPSNSDTNFVMKREKEKRQISETVLKEKGKSLCKRRAGEESLQFKA